MTAREILEKEFTKLMMKYNFPSKSGNIKIGDIDFSFILYNNGEFVELMLENSVLMRRLNIIKTDKQQYKHNQLFERSIHDYFFGGLYVYLDCDIDRINIFLDELRIISI